MLEAEMLAVGSDHDEEEFQPLLPDLSEFEKCLINSNHWKNVDSEQLLGAEEELMDDQNLIDDPNISAICLPLNSEGKKSKCDNENLNGTSSKLKSKAKLNCTVPKNMAGFWNDSKRLNLKCATLPYNQLAEVKSIGDFITPKRLDTKEENYSQASTPVPGYSKKSSAAMKTNLNVADKQIASKIRIQDRFKLYGSKAKAINKSAITVKDDHGYFSVQTKKDFK